MNNLTLRRLNRELLTLQTETSPDYIIKTPTSIMEWTAIINGPESTPYENGQFELKIKFDMDYPVKAPSVKFLTKVYHPNIYFQDGKICVDILQPAEWSPIQNVRSILLSIISLLMDPNTDSPANREAANMYNNDRSGYETKVRTIVASNEKY
jgi:ubiquitin-conjugating enzyme E2 A